MLGKAFAPLDELWDNWVASNSKGSGGSGGAGGNNGSTGGLSGTGSQPPDWEPGNGGDRYSKDNGNSLKDRLDQSDYNKAERLSRYKSSRRKRMDQGRIELKEYRAGRKILRWQGKFCAVEQRIREQFYGRPCKVRTLLQDQRWSTWDNSGVSEVEQWTSLI